MRLGRYLLGSVTPGRKKFKWNSHYAKAKNGPETLIENLHEISLGASRKGPLAFTKAHPKSLEGFDPNIIELCNNSFVCAASIDQQKPCAKIVPDRMGLHPYLLEQLGKRYRIEQFTPIQARILQNFHAHHDICSCAPTGSGKTLAICIALVARLMREGPPKQGSTIFLVPTAELGYQIERWLRSLWWYTEAEDPLFLSHCTSSKEVGNAYAIGAIEEDILKLGDQSFILPNLSENIRYPPRNPYILLSTPEIFWHWLQNYVPMSENQVNKKLFPQLDTIIIDEVEEVIRVDGNLADHFCAGRKVLKQLYVCRMYDAPIQVLFNSATLGPTTLNHLRAFMKKNVFDPASVKMFPDTDSRGEYAHCTDKGYIRGDMQSTNAGNHGSFLATERLKDESARRTHMRKMRYYIPSSVNVSFYLQTAMSTELREKRLRSILATIKSLLTGTFQCSKALVIVETDEDENYMIRALQCGNELGGVKKVHPIWQKCIQVVKEREDQLKNANQATDSADLEPSQTIVVSSSRRIRGIDIPGLQICFVIGAPKNVMEFVHLAGRVGRLGNNGTCLFLIHPKDCRVMQDYCSLLDIDFYIQNKEDFYSDSNL